ncbi:MAG: sulfotransferase [Reichenbachiella sp.]|uniref:sulfotransferase n=1 Tax=Reichenbachiella sp. TaxID=2184521 RepID=UPI00326434E7
MIGFNKTGTTSLYFALKELGYVVGNQVEAEMMIDEIAEEDYSSLIKYCKSAEAFQDFPFSTPNIYKTLDINFPGSKFILTIRDSEDQWFDSVVKYHTKLWSKDGQLQKAEEDLAKISYLYEGYVLKALKYVYGEGNYYDRELYTGIYRKHNHDVMEYFKNRPNDFLVINLSDSTSYNRFCTFINRKSSRDQFDWKNKTSDIST